MFGCNIIDDGNTLEYSCSSNRDVTLQCLVDNEPLDECKNFLCNCQMLMSNISLTIAEQWCCM